MIELPGGRRARFLSESGAPEPRRVHEVDDAIGAAEALRRIRGGQVLLWTGDYRNGRQLLSAMGRRLDKSVGAPSDGGLGARWTREREVRRARGQTLGQVLVLLEPDGELRLRRAPSTRRAVELAWGSSPDPRVVALNTLVGALSAAEWTDKGLEVPGLEGRITPRFGVFSPTRRAYVDLLEHLEVDGRSVLDVGCGTGVLGLVLLQRGASRVVGTDCEERAVTCANDNARELGLHGRYRAELADLFPEEGRSAPFDLVLFNAPWVPETPRTSLDRAVFDEGGETLRRFLRLTRRHLAPGGSVGLLISDLPERLGLRKPGDLERMFEGSQLTLRSRHSTRAVHGRAKNVSDPLHQARGAECVELFLLSHGEEGIDSVGSP